MPWVKFTKDFDFHVKRRPLVTVAYKAGGEYLVKKACAEQAIEQGKAEKIERKDAIR